MDKNKLALPAAILIGCIILGGFYYASEVNKQVSIERQQQATLQAQQAAQQATSTSQNNIDLQTQCANAASSYYAKNGGGTTDTNGYFSHWNTSLNKCYIEYSTEDDNNGDDDIEFQLADAIGGTVYADIDWTIPNEDTPHWCELYPDGINIDSTERNCSSKTEFDNFVKPYMTN